MNDTYQASPHPAVSGKTAVQKMFPTKNNVIHLAFGVPGSRVS